MTEAAMAIFFICIRPPDILPTASKQCSTFPPRQAISQRDRGEVEIDLTRAIGKVLARAD
jgi:hypothetical protein